MRAVRRDTKEPIIPPYQHVLPRAFQAISQRTGQRPLIVIDDVQQCLEMGTLEFNAATEDMLEFLLEQQQSKAVDVLLLTSDARVLNPLRRGTYTDLF